MPISSWLSNLFRPTSPAPSAAGVAEAPPAAPPLPVAAPLPASPVLRPDGFNYPSLDPGIPAMSADAILAANEDMIARVKLAYGCDAATFERDIVRVVRSFASYVNLLPATADNYFATPGGMFRLGLETGFYALQGTDAQIFEGRATISARRQLEPRWRLATFIAGLCAEVHRTLSHLTVRDGVGQAWPSYLVGLTPWLDEQSAGRMFPRWDPSPQESRASGVFAFPLIVDRATMQYLATGNAVVVPHMMAAISGTALYREHNVLDDLVRRATAMVIDRNLRADTDRYGQAALGAHLERYLVDAMRRLAASNQQWRPNQRQTRVWYGRDGMYLIWPKAVQEVLTLLESERLPGMPKVAETLLEILVDAKVVEARDNARATWEIQPPGAEVVFEAVRLTTPDVLLTSFTGTVTPLDCVLQHHRPGTVPAATPVNGPAQATSVETSAARRSASGPGHLPPADVVDDADEVPPDLFPPGAADGVAARPPPSHPSASAPVAAQASRRDRFALTPPLRLHRKVGDALGAIVETLNDRQGQCVRTVATGLFIPMAVLRRRNLDPTFVQRELDGAGMLALGPNGTRIQTHEFDGSDVPGLVLLPNFIKGLDAADFAAAGATEGDDADA